MNQIRYKQRDCKDSEKIKTFLEHARTGVIGMASEGVPYAVPVNFVYHEGNIYFHGMGSGKKEDILSKKPYVCFTVYEEHGTVTDPVPCHADTAYMSVMLFGKVEKVTDTKEAAEVLQRMLDKFMPGFYNQQLSSQLIEKYRSSFDGNAVSVYRMTTQEITAKENCVENSKLYMSAK